MIRIRLSHPLGLFLLPCYIQTSTSPKLLTSFPASDITLGVHPVESAAELLYHRRILALGLTERANIQPIGTTPHRKQLISDLVLFSSDGPKARIWIMNTCLKLAVDIQLFLKKTGQDNLYQLSTCGTCTCYEKSASVAHQQQSYLSFWQYRLYIYLFLVSL